jgi:hypothetical protein
MLLVLLVTTLCLQPLTALIADSLMVTRPLDLPIYTNKHYKDPTHACAHTVQQLLLQ